MIHQTLKEVRKEKGMTLQEVSDRTNIPVRTIERIESGETRLDMERLELLAQVYDMSPTEIMALDNKGIHFSVDNSTGGNNGVAYYCVFHENEKDKYEKLLRAKDELIEAQSREIELLKQMKGGQ